LAGWESTTFLVGEYRSDEVGELPEFAVADCIIELRNRPQELTTLREVEVLKLRGSHYESGRHFFDIDASGLTFYPRVRAPEQTGTGPLPTGERVSTGVKGLDAHLGGGSPQPSTTAAQDRPGTGMPGHRAH